MSKFCRHHSNLHTTNRLFKIHHLIQGNILISLHNSSLFSKFYEFNSLFFHIQIRMQKFHRFKPLHFIFFLKSKSEIMISNSKNSFRSPLLIIQFFFNLLEREYFPSFYKACDLRDYFFFSCFKKRNEIWEKVLFGSLLNVLIPWEKRRFLLKGYGIRKKMKNFAEFMILFFRIA